MPRLSAAQTVASFVSRIQATRRMKLHVFQHFHYIVYFKVNYRAKIFFQNVDDFMHDSMQCVSFHEHGPVSAKHEFCDDRQRRLNRIRSYKMTHLVSITQLPCSPFCSDSLSRIIMLLY